MSVFLIIDLAIYRFIFLERDYEFLKGFMDFMEEGMSI